jgi:hypothetical protein
MRIYALDADFAKKYVPTERQKLKKENQKSEKYCAEAADRALQNAQNKP